MRNISLEEAIAVLDGQVNNPTDGLPDEIFYYISRTTPLINVDLLVKDENGRTLLSWRDDEYTGRGWHIPGGIIRFKETLETRIKKVAKLEIGTSILFDKVPVAIHQAINHKRNIRGHFISLLYRCHLRGTFRPKNAGLTNTDPGFLMWHESCPRDLLKVQNVYRKYINDTQL